MQAATNYKWRQQVPHGVFKELHKKPLELLTGNDAGEKFSCENQHGGSKVPEGTLTLNRGWL